MKLLVKSKKLISCILVVALLTGCGASLRSSEKVQNEPLDTLIKLENKEDQILSTTEENSSYTTQIPVPEKFIEKYDDVVVPINAGDAVFFNMLLFHRSGQNVSNQIRFAVQGRFHTSTSDDFIPFDLINYYNPYIKQKLEKKYDCSDIPNNKRQPPIALN